MEENIVGGNLGQAAKYSVSFKEGKLVAELDAKVMALSGLMKIELDSDAVFDAIKEAIPGKIDDKIIEMLKAAIK